MKRIINKKIYFFFFLIIFLPNDVASQSNKVPYHIQAAFFGKIFNHISPLKKNNPIKVLIVYNEKTESDKTIFFENMRQLGLSVNAVKPFQLVMNITDTNVVYFMPGLQKHAKLCREYRKLSLSGTTDHIEDGEISIAIGIEKDKPKVYINLGLMQSEGNDVSAALLKISKVYR